MQPGTLLGPYSITGALGAGAMGEVYRARDRKLERDVAIKVLPSAFMADRERLARFEKEARVLASLNHPHVAQIYGFEHSGDVRGLVLELVEGETIADRLRGTASRSGQPSGLPVAEALHIARQIADALDAAHEKGIVHRDLKPANVKITPGGVVKVLDFGLAKTLQGAATVEATFAPTLTLAATEHGALIGSAPYMSPEQARGQSVDKRTDIWALGCVLYEMLTGHRAFRGATASDVLAAVLEREPDWSALPEATPPAIERLLRRCLDKDPKRRLHDVADARLEIEEALTAPATPVATAPARPRSRSGGWAAGAAALGVLLGALAVWMLTGRSKPAAPADPIRLSMPFLEPPDFCLAGCRRLAISEDGSRVAYSGFGGLWIRQMNRPDAVALQPGGANPYFSPDGNWVGAGLHKIPLDGGPPTQIIADTDRLLGATWGANDTIVFATSEGLYQVAAAGGEARLLVRPDRSRGELLYAWPHFLPGGRSVLFTIVPDDRAAAAKIASLDLESLETEVVLSGGTDARYVATGHLVYASGSALMAVPFHEATGRVRGAPRSFPGIEVATAADNGAADFAVSAQGTLVFMPPASSGAGDGRATPAGDTLQWIDRDGTREPVAIKPGTYLYPRVSPDGTRVAMDAWTDGNRDVWIFDLERSTSTQLTDGPTEDLLPLWSLDGSRVFFASDRAGNMDVYSQAADGASPPRVELAAPGPQFPNVLTPDGTRLLVAHVFSDIGMVTLGQPDRLEPLLHSPANEGRSDVSADGRWIVYESDESGSQYEIFARPFPDVTAVRTRISVDGGRYPLFSPDDREIYYLEPDGDMMAAAVTFSPSLEVGSVRKLFTWRRPHTGGVPYSVSPLDGRFLVIEPAEAEGEGPSQNVSVVLNWFPELTRLVPTKP